MPNKLKALDTTPPHPASTGRRFALHSACWQPASSTAVSHPPGVGLVTPLCQTRCVSGFHSSVQVHILFDPAASFPPSSSSTAVLTSSWTKQHVFPFDDVTTGSWRGSQTSPGCCHHSHLLQSAALTASSAPPASSLSPLHAQLWPYLDLCTATLLWLSPLWAFCTISLYVIPHDKLFTCQ